MPEEYTDNDGALKFARSLFANELVKFALKREIPVSEFALMAGLAAQMYAELAYRLDMEPRVTHEVLEARILEGLHAEFKSINVPDAQQ
jgi:hypothetical protein